MARRGKFRKAAPLVGAAAVAAGVLLKRDKVAGLVRSRSGGGQDTGWAPAPAPAPSNYDAPGPVANTATPVPAPDAQVLTEEGGIDERAEEAAAAAEAAGIGGPVGDYAAIDEPSLGADEADRPLVEAGEGSSEGQEQAEAALADAASPTAPGMSDYERQIDDVIEQAEQPGGAVPFGAGTTAPEPEPEPTADHPVTPGAPRTSSWQPPAPPAPPESSDPTPPTEEPPPGKDGEDDGDEWKTWSGRAINP